MGYPKNLRSPGLPGYAHAPLSPKFLWALVRMHPMNVLATLSSLLALLVPELIGGGRRVATSQKLVRFLAMPTLSIPLQKNPMLTVQTIYLCTRFPAILDCCFEWELRTPNLGKGETVGGREWHRSKERW